MEIPRARQAADSGESEMAEMHQSFFRELSIFPRTVGTEVRLCTLTLRPELIRCASIFHPDRQDVLRRHPHQAEDVYVE